MRLVSNYVNIPSMLVKKATACGIIVIFVSSALGLSVYFANPAFNPKQHLGWHCGLKLCECRFHHHHDGQAARGVVPERFKGLPFISESSDREVENPFQWNSNMTHFLLPVNDQSLLDNQKQFLSHHVDFPPLPVFDGRLDIPPRIAHLSFV